MDEHWRGVPQHPLRVPHARSARRHRRRHRRRLELHPLVCGLRGRPHSGRPADRLCFPPLPSQVRSRPNTSSARAAGDLAAASRWSRAAPSPSMAARARVDEVLRGSRLGRSSARDGGSWPLVADDDAPCGRSKRARVRPGWVHPDGGCRVECECVRAVCAAVGCTCTVCGPGAANTRLTYRVGRALAVCGLSLREVVVCTYTINVLYSGHYDPAMYSAF